MTDADTIPTLIFSLKIVSVCSVAITGIAVLMLALQTRALRTMGKNLEATRCIVCRMVGAKECWNGYKKHCDDILGERQVFEKEKKGAPR